MVIDENASLLTEILQVKQEKNLLRRLIRTDQREFITGTSGVTMQAAYIINAIRSNRRNYKEKTALKKVVILDNTNHSRLDLYGAIAISPGRTRLSEVYAQLVIDNDEWESRVNNGGDKDRNLNMHKLPYDIDTIEWEIVVLHAEDVLPPGDGMFVNKQEACTIRGQSQVFSSMTCHIPQFDPLSIYNYHLRLPCLLDSDDNVFRFTMTTSRPPNEKLSLFAMMINLQSKLQAYVDNAPKPYLSIWELLTVTNSVVDAIYFHPDPPNLRLQLEAETTTVPTSQTPSSTQNAEMSSPSPERDLPTPTVATFPSSPFPSSGISSGCLKGAQKTRASQMLLFGARGYPEFVKPIRASDLDEEGEESSSETASLESDLEAEAE
ncbi:hypothetical protein BDP27DRAFT_1344818 [Rhodocollybia butyracea]|uniref:Uncharacterized protein n=1 Tax=Rhodocollybia butyracea TaxID=206335 RepID=A0A9P5P9B1_9AGAR|nr:hypothetical protein BDP27DRAFT_1344818 [Rhodocollybia butyracea]